MSSSRDQKRICCDRHDRFNRGHDLDGYEEDARRGFWRRKPIPYAGATQRVQDWPGVRLRDFHPNPDLDRQGSGKISNPVVLPPPNYEELRFARDPEDMLGPGGLGPGNNLDSDDGDDDEEDPAERVRKFALEVQQYLATATDEN